MSNTNKSRIKKIVVPQVLSPIQQNLASQSPRRKQTTDQKQTDPHLPVDQTATIASAEFVPSEIVAAAEYDGSPYVLLNVYFPQLDPELSVALVSSCARTNTVVVQVALETEEGKIIKHDLTVPIRQIYRKDMVEIDLKLTEPATAERTLVTDITEQAAPGQAQAGEKKFAPTSYMTHPLFTRTKERLQKELGNEAVKRYEAELQLHVTAVGNRHKANNESSTTLVQHGVAKTLKQISPLDQVRVKELSSKLRFSATYNPPALQVAQLIGEWTSAFMDKFIVQDEELLKINANVLQMIEQKTKIVTDLAEQVTGFDMSKLLMSVQYKQLTSDRKNQALTVTQSLFQTLMSPDVASIQQQLEEFRQIQKQISLLGADRRFAAELLFYWRALVPILLFMTAGQIYLQLEKLQQQTITSLLKTDQVLKVEDQQLQNVLLMLVRCVEQQQNGMIQTFVQYMERSVLMLDDTKLLEHSNAKPDTAFDATIRFQLEHMKFRTSSHIYDKSPYKADLDVDFELLPTLQAPEQYSLKFKPDPDELCQSLMIRIQTVYLTFSSIPLAVSRNYFYANEKQAEGWADLYVFFNIRTAKQQSHMQHYSMGSSQKQAVVVKTGYELLLAEDKFHIVKDSFMKSFGRCPVIFIFESSLQNAETVDVLFQQISSVIRVGMDYLEFQLKETNFMQHVTGFYNGTLVQILKKVYDEGVIFSEDTQLISRALSEIESLNVVLNQFRKQVINIPDFFHQFMIRISFKKFKEQLITFVNMQRKKAYEEVLQLFSKFVANVQQFGTQIIGDFSSAVKPDSIEQSERLTMRIENSDKMKQHNMFCEFADGMHALAINYYDVVEISDSHIGTLITLMLTFPVLFKKSQFVRSQAKQLTLLYTSLVGQLHTWLSTHQQKVVRYIEEVFRLSFEDQKEAVNYPARFKSKFPNISHNFKVDQLEFNSKNSESKQFELGFYQSILETTSLPICTKLADKNKLASSKLYDKPAQRSNEEIKIALITEEMIYIIEQTKLIEMKMTEWEKALGVEPKSDIINFAELKKQASIIYHVVYSVEFIDKIVNSRTAIKEVDSQKLMELLQSSIDSIKIIKNVSKTYSIVSQGVSLLDVSYASWVDYASIAEVTLVAQSPIIHALHIIKSNFLQQSDYDIIFETFKLRLEDTTLDKLITLINEKPLVIDYLEVLLQNAKADADALNTLIKIEKYVQSIKIEKIVKTDATVHVIVARQEGQTRRGLKDITAELDEKQRELSYLQSLSHFILVEQQQGLSQDALRIREKHLRLTYSDVVWQRIKDVEATIVGLKFVLGHVYNVPRIIDRLKFIFENCNVITNAPSKSEANESYMEFSINYLSQAEKNSISLQSTYWGEISTKYMQPGQKLTYLCSNQTVLAQLTATHVTLINVLDRVYEIQNQIILQQFRAEINFCVPSRTAEQEVQNLIIPFHSGVLYPHALVMPTMYEFTYGTFPHQSVCFKFLNQLQQKIIPGITDIVLGQSSIRGRVILGLCSDTEFMEFSTSVTAPTYNYMLVDSFIHQIKPTFTKYLDEKLDKLETVVKELYTTAESLNFDFDKDELVVMTARLSDFIDATLSSAFFVMFQTILKKYMERETSINNLKKLEDVKNITVFQSVLVVIKLFQLSIKTLKCDETLKKRLANLFSDYGQLFTKLSSEIQVKLFSFFRRKQLASGDVKMVLEDSSEVDDQSSAESVQEIQELSLIALLNSTTVTFPLLEYVKNTNTIYLTSTTGNYSIAVGDWWNGKLSSIPSLTIQQYIILEQLAKALAQKTTVIIFSQQFSGYAIEIDKILQVFAEYAFKPYVKAFVSQSTFGEDLQKIQALLLCGYIVSIIGSEYLDGQQQHQLEILSLRTQQHHGQCQGILTPFISAEIRLANQQKNEIQTPLGFRHTQTEDFQFSGFMIFVVPQLSSALKQERTIYVPPINTKMVDRKSMSLSFNLENSSISEDLTNDVGQTQSKTGQHTLISGNTLCLKGKQLQDSLKSTQCINFEDKSAMLKFLKISKIHGKALFEVVSYLQSLDASIGKVSLQDVETLVSRVDQSNTNKLVQILIHFIMRNSSCSLQNQGHLFNDIGIVVSSAFGLSSVEQEIVEQQTIAYTEIQQQMLNQIVSLRQPSSLIVSYDEYYKKYIQIDQQASVIKMFKGLYQLPTQTIVDLLLLKDLLRTNQPSLIISPDYENMQAMFTLYTKIFKQSIYFVSSIEHVEDIMIKQQQNQNNITIGYHLTHADQFSSLTKLILAFSQQQFYYENRNSVPLSFQGNFFIYCNISIEKQLRNSEMYQYLFHKVLISQQINITQLTDSFPRVLNHKTELKHLSENSLLKIKSSYERQMLKVSDSEKQQIEQFETLQCFAPFIISSYINHVFTTLQPIFGIGVHVNEAKQLYSLIMLYLFRSNLIIQTKPHYKEQALRHIEPSSESFLLFYDQIKQEMKNQLNENLKGNDLTGMFSKIQTKSIIYKQIEAQLEIRKQFISEQDNEYQFFINLQNIDKREQKLKQKMQELPGQSFDFLLEMTLRELHNDMKNLSNYQVNPKFLISHCNKSYIDAIQIMLSVIFGAVFTSFQNVIVVQNQSTSDDDLINMFEKSKVAVQEQSTNIDFDSLSVILSALLQIDIDKSQENQALVDQLKQKDCILITKSKNHKTLIQDWQRLNKILMDGMPNTILHKYQYLWFDSEAMKLKAIDFELGIGLFQNLSNKSEKSIIEEMIFNQAKDSFEYMNNYTEQYQAFKDELYKQQQALQEAKLVKDEAFLKKQQIVPKPPSFEPKIIEDPNSISIQRLASNYIAIDKQRVAIASLIAGLILCDTVAVVSGERNSGKSMLIKIACLLVRDLISYKQAFVRDPSNEAELKMIRQTCEENSILIGNSIKLFGFETQILHVTMSESHINTMCKQFHNLVETKSLLYDSDIDTNTHFTSGKGYFSDTSIILEINTAISVINDFACTRIEIPPFTEEFLVELVKNQWPLEKIEWQKLFAKGIWMILNEMPKQLSNSFTLFERMTDLLQLTSNKLTTTYATSSLLQKFQESQDQELFRGTIHTIFQALRNRSDITQDVQNSIAEKLATLSILKSLESESDNPWKDAMLLIKTQKHMIPVWEQIISTKQIEDTELSPESGFYKNYRQHFKDIIINNNDQEQSLMKVLQVSPEFVTSIKLRLPCFDAQITIAEQYYSSKFIDSAVASRIFESFILLTSQSELQRAYLSIMNDQQHNQLYLSANAGCNSHSLAIKNLLLQACTHYNQILTCANKLRQTQFQVTQRQSDQLFDQIKGNFQGYSLIDLFETKVPKAIVKFESVPASQYIQSVLLYASMGNYHIFCSDSTLTVAQSYDSKVTTDDAQSTNEQKVLIDIYSLFQGLNQSTTKKHVQQEDDILTIVKQMLQDYTGSENLDFIAVYLLLRVAIAYALGLNPLSMLTSPQNYKKRFGLSSHLTTNLPYDVQAVGPTCNQRYPTQLQNDFNFQKYLTETFGTREEIEFINIREKQIDNKNQNLYQKHVGQQKQVCIMSPLSLLEAQDSRGISVLSLLTNVTEQGCSQENLFTKDEIISMCQILSLNKKLNIALKPKELASILSGYFQIIIIDDSPLDLRSQTNWLEGFKNIGTVKSPVCELITNYQKIHNNALQDLNRSSTKENNISLQQNIEKHMKKNETATNLLLNSETLRKAQHNIVFFRPNQFLSIYQASGCTMTQQFELPERLQINWKYQENVFALGVLATYEFLSNNATVPCISLAQFSKQCASMSNMILSQCQSFLQRLNTIFVSYRFFEILSNNQPAKMIQFDQLSSKKFITLIKQVSNFDQLSDAQILCQTEALYIRDALYTLIEVLKPYYKIVQNLLKTAIFEAIMIVSYVQFRFSNNISDDVITSLIIKNTFGDSFEKDVKEKFAALIVAILRKIGANISISKTSDRKPLCVLGQDGPNLILDNAIKLLGLNSPISLILRLNDISWQNGDRSQIGLQVATILSDLDISTLFVEKHMAMATGQLLFAKQIQSLEIGNSDVKLEQSLKNSVALIDMDQKPEHFLMQLQKIMESSNSSILFQNFDTKTVPMMNKSILAKIISLKNLQFYQAGQSLFIQNRQFVLYQDLHKYNIVVSYEPETDIHEVMKTCGMSQQEIYDKLGILVFHQGRYAPTNDIHDVITKAIYGEKYSLRQQQLHQYALSRQSYEKIKDLQELMKSYLKQILSRIPSIGAVKVEQVEQELSQLSNQIQSVPTAIQQIMRNVGVIQINEVTHLENLVQTVQDAIGAFYERFNDQQQSRIPNLDEKIEAYGFVSTDGLKLTQTLANASEASLSLILAISKSEASFSLYYSPDFLKQIQLSLSTGTTEFIHNMKQRVQQKIEREDVSDEYIIAYLTKHLYQELLRETVKAILNVFIRFLRSACSESQFTHYYLLIKFFFLSSSNVLCISQEKGDVSQQQEMKFMVQCLQQNNDEFKERVLLNMIMEEFADPIRKEKSVVPSHMQLSQSMLKTWYSIVTLKRNSSIINDSIPQFLQHFATIAGIGESPNPIQSIIYYYLEQASTGNQGCEKIFNQLQLSNQLFSLMKDLNVENRDIIQLLPNSLSAPTPPIIFAISLLLSSARPSTLIDNMHFIDFFLAPYSGFSLSEVMNQPADAFLKYDTAIETKLLQLAGPSIAAVFELGHSFYPCNSAVDKNLIDINLINIFQLLNGAIRQAEADIQNSKYRTTDTVPQVILLYYDSCVIAGEFVKYCFNLLKADKQSVLMERLKLQEKYASYMDILEYLVLVQLDDQHSVYALADALQKAKFLKTQTMPVVAMVRNDRRTDDAFSKAIGALISVASPKILLVSAPNNPMEAVAHVITVSAVTLQNENRVNRTALVRRQGVCAGSEVGSPTLTGLVCFLLKHAILLLRPRESWNDRAAVQALRALDGAGDQHSRLGADLQLLAGETTRFSVELTRALKEHVLGQPEALKQLLGPAMFSTTHARLGDGHHADLIQYEEELLRILKTQKKMDIDVQRIKTEIDDVVDCPRELLKIEGAELRVLPEYATMEQFQQLVEQLSRLSQKQSLTQQSEQLAVICRPNLASQIRKCLSRPELLYFYRRPSFVGEAALFSDYVDQSILRQVSVAQTLIADDPKLGDVLAALVFERAAQVKISVQRVKLVGLLHRPTQQPVIAPDGSIQMSADEPGRVIKITGFELYNAAYDKRLETICDETPESRAGCRQLMNVFAAVAMIENEDPEYERNLKNKMVNMNARGKVRAPQGFVAVPVVVAGRVSPVVLLQNKTSRDDKDWEARGVYLGPSE